MKVRLITMNPVKFGNWLVKGSSTNLDSICIFMYNVITEDVNIRFFSDEITANYFIENILASEE